MILAGDVGGTKTNVGLFRPGADRPEVVRKANYESAAFSGLAPLVSDFLAAGGERPEIACFGVAGPVSGNRVETPNLAWDVDGDRLASDADLPRVVLMNDLEAAAEGIPALAADEVETLAEGDPEGDGNAALIAAGTGLGMCVVARRDGTFLPVAGEGGHQSFAARNEEEEALRRFLAARHGHVSVERVVSGPGLVNVYEFLVEGRGRAPSPAVADRMAAKGDPSAISEAAMRGECEVCRDALRIFLAAYGAAAGNLALVALARSGLYVGGGIAPKILPALRDGTFLAAFCDKGRFEPLVRRVPVRVILNPEAALLGAARRATQTSTQA